MGRSRSRERRSPEGGGGVWITAVLVDTTVVLKKVSFSGLSGPAVEILKDGGYTGTVIGEP
jgi:hypothetical protein